MGPIRRAVKALRLAATLCLALAPTAPTAPAQPAPAQPAPAQPAAPATVADAPPKPTEKQLRAWWNEQAKFKLPANTYVEFEYEQPEQRVKQRVRVWAFNDGVTRVCEDTPDLDNNAQTINETAGFLDSAIMPDGRRWLWVQLATNPNAPPDPSQAGTVRVVNGRAAPPEYEPSRLVTNARSNIDMLMGFMVPNINAKPLPDPSNRFDLTSNDTSTDVTLGWTITQVKDGIHTAWLPATNTITKADDSAAVGHSMRFSDHQRLDFMERWAAGRIDFTDPSGGLTLTLRLIEARPLNPDESAPNLTALPSPIQADVVRGSASIQYVEHYNAAREESTFVYTDREPVTVSHNPLKQSGRVPMGTIALVLSIAVAVAGAGWMIVKKVSSNG